VAVGLELRNVGTNYAFEKSRRFLGSSHIDYGDVTGVTIMSSALVPKRLEIIRELLPGSRRLALLVNVHNPNQEANVKDARADAQGTAGPRNR
jgi:hypothetical protein